MALQIYAVEVSPPVKGCLRHQGQKKENTLPLWLANPAQSARPGDPRLGYPLSSNHSERQYSGFQCVDDVVPDDCDAHNRAGRKETVVSWMD